MITTPIYTRILSPYDYGIISTYNTWYGILSVIFTLSIASNFFNKGLVEYFDDRDNFVGNMTVLTASLVAFGFGVITIFKSYVVSMSGLDYKYFVIMFVSMFFNVVYGFWGLCSKFDEKYVKVVIANIGIAVLTIIFTIIFLTNLNGERSLIYIMPGAIINGLFGIYLTFKYLKKSSVICFRKYWKAALLFCIPLIPHYMSNHLLNQADRMMITSMCGAEETGIYTIAYKIPEILNMLWSCVTAIYIPWLYKNLGSESILKVKKTNSIIILVFAIVALAVNLLAPEIISILASSEYKEGIYIVPALMVGYFCSVVCLIFSNIELFFDKNKIITAITLMAAVINIGLNYLLIPSMGYKVAAYTTYIGYFVMFILHVLYVRKERLSRFVNIKLMSLLVIVNTFVGLCMVFLYDYLLIRWCVIFVMGIFCFIRKKKIISFVEGLRL